MRPKLFDDVQFYNKICAKFIYNKKPGWYRPVLAMCKYYYKKYPDGGNLSRVLNPLGGYVVGKHNLAWVSGYSCAKDDELALKILQVIGWMDCKQLTRLIKYGTYLPVKEKEKRKKYFFFSQEVGSKGCAVADRIKDFNISFLLSPQKTKKK